jgi:Flp pilus assembly pilin Flp
LPACAGENLERDVCARRWLRHIEAVYEFDSQDREEQAQELRVLSVSILIFSSANPENRKHSSQERSVMFDLPLKLWRDEAGQDIAEYAVMLAVILVLVVGTVRLVGNNANNAFSSVASTIQ